MVVSCFTAGYPYSPPQRAAGQMQAHAWRLLHECFLRTRAHANNPDCTTLFRLAHPDIQRATPKTTPNTNGKEGYLPVNRCAYILSYIPNRGFANFRVDIGLLRRAEVRDLFCMGGCRLGSQRTHTLNTSPSDWLAFPNMGGIGASKDISSAPRFSCCCGGCSPDFSMMSSPFAVVL